MRALRLCLPLLLITIAITPVRAQDPASPISLNRAEEYALAAYCATQTADAPFLTRLAVAAVMLNRLKDPHYPDTVSGVLSDGGFTAPAVKEEDLASALWAVRVAAMGVDPTGGSLAWAFEGTGESADLIPRLRVGKRIFGTRAYASPGENMLSPEKIFPRE